MTRPILAAALALAVTAAPATAQEFTFRFASLTPEGGYVHETHLRPFVEAVMADSDGRIAIDLQPVGVFGPPAQAYELVEAGIIDMAWTVQGYTGGRFPQSSVFELPFLYERAEHGSAALWTMYEEGHFDRDYGSVKPLALYMHRPYGLFTTGRAVETVADMAGLRVRTPSAVMGQALEMLGATPVGMQVTEMPEALRLGTIDSSVFPWEAITLFGLQESLEVLTDAQIAAPRFIVLMNRASYDRLPDDLKAVIDRHSGLEMSRRIGAGLDARELEDLARFDAMEGYRVIRLEEAVREDMQARTAPLLDVWKADMARSGVDGAAMLARAQELIAEME